MRFKDKVVVVTGGASGIGLGVVRRFVSEGARAAVLDLNALAERFDRDLGLPDAECLVFPVDVTDGAAVEGATERILAAWGRLDVWVNNAGIFNVAHIAEEPDLADWERIVAVNLTAVFLGCQVAARPMIAQQSGVILNISSVAGKIGFPEEAGYCGTKAGVIGLTRSVAMELVGHGIRVNAICPGNILTPMLQALDERICSTRGWERGTFLQQEAQCVPVGYIGEPADVASLAAFLASDDASFIVGQAINVDGGWVLSR